MFAKKITLPPSFFCTECATHGKGGTWLEDAYNKYGKLPYKSVQMAENTQLEAKVRTNRRKALKEERLCVFWREHVSEGMVQNGRTRLWPSDHDVL